MVGDIQRARERGQENRVGGGGRGRERGRDEVQTVQVWMYFQLHNLMTSINFKLLLSFTTHLLIKV